ncbi:glycosyl hydrolase catalytic core-domain-containing protein [Thermothelomyces heterothallicus CBS 202.75]|uniref:glycosyl hydrolase catalytic core-domain-containing protein n=1 Tax=Thermothelomyces heterothallicus CBS 202.75 TaxID=1149848 RepID=UPI003742C867
MNTKTLAVLVATTLLGQTVAGPHRHGLQHLHQKRATITEESTVTHWVTVTVYEDGTAPTPEAFYSHSHRFRLKHSSSSPSSSTPVVAPVTSTSAAPTSSSTPVAKAVASSSTTPEADEDASTAPAAPPTSSSSAQAAPSPDPVPVGDGDGGNNDNTGVTGGRAKRGLAYNDPQLLKAFLGDGTKVTWTYNWGQQDDSGTDLEFVPTLWGIKLDFADTWPANAQKAIDAGSKCLFSFNEPELAAQANMSPQLAAQKHIELMNPFSGKARIGSPSITNGVGPNNGIGYLKQFFDACAGKCAVDFVNIHIYGVDTNTFLSHLRDVYAAFNKPVWITEFAFDGTDDEINSQLETVIDQIENNSTYSFVERYSYFMVQDGTMIKNGAPSEYGNTFAYAT